MPAWFRLLSRSALLSGLCAMLCLAADRGVADLYQEFKDPPKTHTVRPFWFWNGKLEAAEVNRQIEEMVAHGVYGAYVHNRTGLQTRYMSEEYFDVVKQAFAKSKELGFHLGFVDEYEWPSGEARDPWRQGVPSRVVASNPDFGMRSLGYVARKAKGSKAVEVEGPEHVQFAIAARLTGEESIDTDSLVDISGSLKGNTLNWMPPEGEWLVMVYYLYASRGLDGGTVDLMNPAAVRKFLDLVHEEYYKRFSEYYGDLLDSFYADHEGTYGFRMAWTPALFNTFQEMKGYDLRKFLPLLTHDGKKAIKIRCDYLDVVSELYYRSFFKQVADWCAAHKVRISGHVWEEALHYDPAFQGDLMRIMRGFSWPGVDSLLDRGRSPRDFKASASVAHFRGTGFTCENQGLQGEDSYLDLQKMRLGTNTIGAWGVTTFIPHAFNYNRQRIEYPEDWFYHQPYWKYFQHYADYARRISSMNSDSLHVADVLLFQPTEAAWADSKPVFNERYRYENAYPAPKWNNPLDTTNTYYTAIINHLAAQRWDYDITDSYFLLQGKVEDKEIRIGPERYKVLVLPPATTMRRAAMERIRAFYDQGGTVIAIRFLPTASMEEGEGDPAIAEHVRHIFGDVSPKGSAQNSNAAGGKAFFVREDVEEITSILRSNFQADFRLRDAAGEDHIIYEHRRKNGVDYYWLVNDSGDAKNYTGVFSAKGAPQKWDAESAARTPVYFRSLPEGTEVQLRFDPWDAWFLAFDPDGKPQPVQVVKTNLESWHVASADGSTVVVRGSAPLGEKALTVELEDGAGKRWQGQAAAPALPPIELKGPWAFTPEKTSVAAPYARRKLDYVGEGKRLGWQTPEYKDISWERQWLSQERNTIRRWALAGPFPNENHEGTVTAYPPEKSVDLSASYKGAGGVELRWVRYDSENYVIDLQKALGIPNEQNWVSSYAVTYVYAPTPRKAWFKVTANNSVKLWVNGQNLLDWHIHPFYYEMREDFALTRKADLKQGWNEVLLKVSKCQWASDYGFLVWVTDEQGNNFGDLAYSTEKQLSKTAQDAPRVAAWYRIPVPPSAAGVKLPAFRKPVTVFYDGKPVTAGANGEIRFASPAEGDRHVLAVRTELEDGFSDTPEFLLGRANMDLGSWTFNGLPYYSGSAAYEREFDLPAAYKGHKLLLECGQVGVTAEVAVNDKPAGVRVWLPYSFDITPYVRPGKNKVRILVTNTMESERSVENREVRLANIKLNGLLGPVRVVPYFDGEIRCPMKAAGDTTSARR